MGAGSRSGFIMSWSLLEYIKKLEIRFLHAFLISTFQMYPPELQLKNPYDPETEVTFLIFHLCISNEFMMSLVSFFVIFL